MAASISPFGRRFMATTISAPTTGFLVENGDVRPMDLAPEGFGLERAAPETVRGGTIEENLRLARSVLAGERLPARDVVLLNAGAGLFVAGLANDVGDGVRLAAELLDSGKVRMQLERIRQVSADLKREQQGAAAP